MTASTVTVIEALGGGMFVKAESVFLIILTFLDFQIANNSLK